MQTPSHERRISFPPFRATHTSYPVLLFSALSKLRYTIQAKNVFHKQFFPVFSSTHSCISIQYSLFVDGSLTHIAVRAREQRKHKTLFLLFRALKLIVKWASASRNFFRVFFWPREDKKVCCFFGFLPSLLTSWIQLDAIWPAIFTRWKRSTKLCRGKWSYRC
jgi:hypothetical protein